MEIMQMRYFLEVASTQHITQSAKHLHIAQPALSQSIKRLENELGVKLFKAKGRNIVLTEYGKYLQQELTSIIDKIDLLPHEISKMAEISEKTVHIRVLAASAMTTQAIIDYENHNNNANFKLFQSENDDACDIEITTMPIYGKRKSTANGNAFVCEEKIFLAVSNTQKYANISKIKLSDVKDEEFISLIGSKQFRYICDKFCAAAGINPKITFESDSPDAVKNMIGANIGIGFWPEFTWGAIESNKVKVLEISNPICKRDVIITCNNTQNETVTSFYNYITKYFSKSKENAAQKRS